MATNASPKDGADFKPTFIFQHPDHIQPKTVKVVCPDTASGFMIINRSDFDPAIHTPYDDAARAAAASGGANSGATVALRGGDATLSVRRAASE